MAVDVRIVTAAVLILAANLTFAQDCSYMVAIPRPERPDFPNQNFEGVPWSQNPLLPAEDREDVCMNAFDPSALNPVTVIFMEEEIEGDVAIARLNYRGTNTPTVVTPFNFGTFHLLGPVIRRIPEQGGDWHLVITQRQDYETPNMQQYIFNVRVEDEPQEATVMLIIVNIDDNAPIIQMFEPCDIPEHGETGTTECKYVVSDADGEISTRFMTFEIESDRNDEEYFELVRENIQGQWMYVHMRLILNKPLDYEENPLHLFRVTALDSLPNVHTVTMMVQVENIESRPPRWMETFAVQQFDEKTAQAFRVRAIDGDTGIDKPIFYRIETEESEKDLFSVETIGAGREGAWFKVAPIDRDTLEKEVFHVSLIAYKYGDNDVEGSSSFESKTDIVIIVNDVNDQAPVPFRPSYFIEIMEETAMTLNLEDFGFHDRDLGPHAQYTVHLESISPAGAHEAFYIAPEVGYQRQSFIVGTQNHHMLDFEVPEFQKIQLRAVAIDMDDPRWVGIAIININLINWNDELPIFEHDVQTVTFKETEGAGFRVATVLAKDRDIDDRVEHSLMGNAVNYLSIDKDTGDILVTIDDAFNYHRQNELFVQIRADDTLGEPYNTNTAQLVIQLQDINNTPPTLRLPRTTPSVEENVPDGFVIPTELHASDPDTTAELRFSIDWDTSYATKQGRDADAKEFVNCIEIETVYPNLNDRGTAIGRVVVREIREHVTIDYEMFEVLYLTVRVTDLNTVIGDDYDISTFTIIIIDMNDNPPLWVEGTLTQEFRVREVAASGVVIGSVLATDIDGPLYNQVRYTITPRLDTPEDLVEIDFNSGQISVKKHQAIDADEPPRQHLYCTVVASDKCDLLSVDVCPPDPNYFNTPGEITIHITDTNNKVPRVEEDKFDETVYIYEGAEDGEQVVQLFASDLDRDEIYHKVSYQTNYAINPRLRDFFEVDLETGLVYVNNTAGEKLDRDGDEPTHRIFFNVIDNFYGEGDGNRNQDETQVLVVLLDINDNYPELPEGLSWDISESLLQGVRVTPDIFAPDRDEPGTDNSRVAYDIVSLTPTDRDITLPQLFTMITIEKDRGIDQTGELETAMDLRGYWGTYEIHVKAYDHGVPQRISYEKYPLVIRPYNFHDPVFVFPQPGMTIRLAKERAVVNGVLATVDGEFLERIVATDEDGLHAGVVTFSISGDDEALQYFDVFNDGVNLGALTITQLFPEDFREFQVTIRATDGGTEPGPRSTDCTVTVVFVPTQGEPVFETSTYTVAFIEKDAGMEERATLPLAKDPRNIMCEDDCHDTYYSIVGGNSMGHFAVDPQSNELFLLTPLDRAEQETHTLIIGASDSPSPAAVLQASTLTVTVNVREANPRPVFQSALYTAGISTLDTINRALLTLHATHSEGLPVTYTLIQDSMEADSTLQAVQETAFNLNPQTGVLTLNFQPTASMHGMFEFDVMAIDTVGETARTEVKVYLISDRNRVFFTFMNTLEEVEPNEDFMAETFTLFFGMRCNIDQTLPASDPATGAARDDQTEVRAHFIRDDLPVPAEEIEQLRGNPTLVATIQNALQEENLNLADLFTGETPILGGEAQARAVYALAAVAAALALLCVVLLILFFIRTRALNRRLEALSMTKYSSQDSGLNRVGLAAPGTNKHAVEGSNPIWNETLKAPDFDALSEQSYDSDLIGIEDLPQFRNDYFPPDEESSMRGVVNEHMPGANSVANHNNNFGFNATPFSPEFANSQLRR
uniref:Cadherin-like Cry1Ac receptor n=1 Tax=Heliothis virescens TaxID=7102 RepID=Q5QD53_HELVI|nr:cadherin-like Cry1Ac receptor [Heliothis virescens]